jgi:phospho-N-acetylmuramoyl-pentapeptide-transferase
MLYYLFDYLNSLDIPGAGVFQYISFRAGMAAFISLLITITVRKKSDQHTPEKTSWRRYS